MALSTNSLINVQFCFNSDNVCLYIYDDKSEKSYNLTDWGLEQFRKKYGAKTVAATVGRGHGKRPTSSSVTLRQAQGDVITKENIFHYVYAVLHNPAYRKKYEINLKREFPRIPLYDNFWKWSTWGKQLMDLHVNYEKAKPFALKTVGAPVAATGGRGMRPRTKADVNDVGHRVKPKLKADKDNGIIILDDETALAGIPKEAWEYKLGNRSALEWVLDQYKESTPSDPTIAEKFNTYKFTDYKKEVIEMLKKVTTVSVETMNIIREMEKIDKIM